MVDEEKETGDDEETEAEEWTEGEEQTTDEEIADHEEDDVEVTEGKEATNNKEHNHVIEDEEAANNNEDAGDVEENSDDGEIDVQHVQNDPDDGADRAEDEAASSQQSNAPETGSALTHNNRIEIIRDEPLPHMRKDLSGIHNLNWTQSTLEIADKFHVGLERQEMHVNRGVVKLNERFHGDLKEAIDRNRGQDRPSLTLIFPETTPDEFTSSFHEIEQLWNIMIEEDRQERWSWLRLPGNLPLKS